MVSQANRFVVFPFPNVTYVRIVKITLDPVKAESKHFLY